jgi:hypothetical protein
MPTNRADDRKKWVYFNDLPPGDRKIYRQLAEFHGVSQTAVVLAQIHRYCDDPGEFHVKADQGVKDGSYYAFGVPKGVFAAFKAKCVLRGTRMRDVVITLMRDFVKNPEPVLAIVEEIEPTAVYQRK